jgi:rifampicin phosphotransferase
MTTASGGEDTDYVIDLSKITHADLSETGGKAANLGELLNAGFPVPEGYVLTTKAFTSFLKENRLDDTERNVDSASIHVPAEVRAALSIISKRLGDASLAVRSSGVSEDLQASSFAGQYATILGVKGEAELVEAVKRCWLSALSKTVAQYRRERSEAGPDEMAILIQKMVNADSAGVAFTVNPVSGRREVRVNAVRGLGDKLVSGSATPDEWVVNEKAVCLRQVQNAITEDQVNEIAQLARSIEHHFRYPQDIEWAIARQKIFLLQARAITTTQEPKGKRKVTPVPIPITVPYGYWTRDRYHFPSPTSPMYASFAFRTMSEVWRKGAREVGLPVETNYFTLIGGQTYRRLVPLGGKDRKPPPSWLLRLLVHVGPSTRSRVKKMREAVRTDLAGQYMEKWRNKWKPELVKRDNELLNVNLASLSDEALEAHLAKALEHMHRGKEIHFRYLGFTLWLIGDLALTCQSLLKWNDTQVFDLLMGVSEQDSVPSRRLAELAQLVPGDKRLGDAIRQINQSTSVEEILKINPAFNQQFESYMKEFGSATLGYEVMVPTMSEMPRELLKMIQGQISANYNSSATADALEKKRATAMEEAMRQMNTLPEETRERFRQTVKKAQAAYALRNENEYYTQFLAEGILRYCLLEIGRRLVTKNVIAERDDIFMLTLEEAREAFKNGGDLKELVEKRWGERAWAEENPGRPSYGIQPPPPAPLDAYPPEVRRLLRSRRWLGDAIATTNVVEEKGQLKGVPASPGMYVGPIRVVKDESEFAKIQPGDVLVCTGTAPSWSVVFSTIGALITETGGTLSHPAIVAREYGIPAVLALEGATRKLRDGMIVKIDGDKGTVSPQG